MTERFEELAGLNRLVHEPARLVILTALASCMSADFLFLQRLTGLTKGNLSSHLTKLAAADLVKVEKRFLGKTPNTTVQITPAGLRAVEQHWQRLDAMRHETRQGQPGQTGERQAADEAG